MFDPGPITPIIIKVVPRATPEVSVVDILLDSLGLTGAILLGSLLGGALLGVLFVAVSRWRTLHRPPGDTDTGVQLNLSAPPARVFAARNPPAGSGDAAPGSHSA